MTGHGNAAEKQLKERIPDKPNGREAQRLETRRRIFEAAVAEFKRTGVADADVGAIVAAAGVARGTFYFHFPSKEHVLIEIENAEVARAARDLERFIAKSPDLAEVLSETVRLTKSAKRRLGKNLFRDVLALYFSPTRPQLDPAPAKGLSVIELVIGQIEQARERGEVYADVDPAHSALFFFLGLYAYLTVSHEGPQDPHALDQYVAGVMRGLEPR